MSSLKAIILTTGIFILFVVLILNIVLNDEPNICDCAIAAKKFYKYNDDQNGKWQNCCEHYRYYIENYGFEKIGEFDVDISDFGYGYFIDNCSNKF
jgi:hypothetical protein